MLILRVTRQQQNWLPDTRIDECLQLFAAGAHVPGNAERVDRLVRNEMSCAVEVALRNRSDNGFLIDGNAGESDIIIKRSIAQDERELVPDRIDRALLVI